MKTKIMNYCLIVAGVGLFTAVSVVNFSAYAALKGVGLR